jgi:hypothetical protein
LKKNRFANTLPGTYATSVAEAFRLSETQNSAKSASENGEPAFQKGAMGIDQS